jgi:hypothetical protein
MGDTARFGGSRASYPAAHHDARALRWRRQSNWDNNGTPREAGDRGLSGTHARPARGAFASGVARPRITGRFESRRLLLRIRSSPIEQLHHDALDIGSQRREGCVICLRPDPDHDVGRYIDREEARSGQFPQTALHPVALDCRLAKAWYDQPDPSPRAFRKDERGSDDPNLECCGSDTLPLFRDVLELRASCDARTSRKPERRAGRVRLRRTCPGCGPSTASVPSCGGEPGSCDPTSFPYAHGTRASSGAACCADGRSAFPWLLQIRSELTKAQTGKVSFYQEIGQAK